MRFWKYIFIILLLVLALVVIAIFQLPDSNFHLIACNVGQGDATLLINRNVQILVDGGPDRKVLDCLGKYLPFYDREIELIILTHPDQDHFQGLTYIFENYKVDNYLSNHITISKPEYQVLEKVVGRGSVTGLYPLQDTRLRLGLIYLDVVSPPEQLSINNLQVTNGKEVGDTETNVYSIVNLVSFGNFRALLTGDMSPVVSDKLSSHWDAGTLDYIKIPHHGSKNGLTDNLLKVTMPKVAIISVGAKNPWGFPSPEILEMLSKYDVKVFRTDQGGNVEVITNGDKMWWKN